MPQDFEQVLCRGLVDELKSAEAFIAMAQEISAFDIKMRFISYAQEELSHANFLAGMLGRQAPGFNCRAIHRPPDFSEGIMAFMVTYLAEEEAAVFYYETLLHMVDSEAEKLILKRIRDEEAAHYEDILEIVQSHADELMEADHA